MYMYIAIPVHLCAVITSLCTVVAIQFQVCVTSLTRSMGNSSGGCSVVRVSGCLH